ncbi:hypothetical protein Pint_26574 [Pistacia integerrima]|uniref:Uncharacterized protein n=1 Tax=Pistacia integerrima TaxID=434235 RepID=A0ACC0YQ15_9ROSI|nr:hypothetical protein Pint_26574 [Pistacia integerrima]
MSPETPNSILSLIDINSYLSIISNVFFCLQTHSTMATLKVPSQTPPATEDDDQLQEAFEGRLGVCCTDIEQIMPVEPSQEESYLARRAVGRDRLTDYNYDKSLGSCSLIDIPEVEQPERPRERIYPVSIGF